MMFIVVSPISFAVFADGINGIDNTTFENFDNPQINSLSKVLNEFKMIKENWSSLIRNNTWEVLHNEEYK